MKSKAIKSFLTTLKIILGVGLGLWLFLISIFLFYTFLSENKTNRPNKEGVWFCHELDAQISYEPNYDTYYSVDGERLLCAFDTDRGRNDFSLLCQDRDSELYLGKFLFDGYSLYCDESNFVVLDLNSGLAYNFQRID